MRPSPREYFPDAAVTSAAAPGTTLDLRNRTHLVTTNGTGIVSRLNLPDGKVQDDTARVMVVDVVDSSDWIEVYMTMIGAYDRVRFDNPTTLHSGFEVQWNGSVWVACWYQNCAPYFSPS